jgi:hypothetical protein
MVTEFDALESLDVAGPREGEETETGERGGGAEETKRSKFNLWIDPRDGEETEGTPAGPITR